MLQPGNPNGIEDHGGADSKVLLQMMMESIGNRQVDPSSSSFRLRLIMVCRRVLARTCVSQSDDDSDLHIHACYVYGIQSYSSLAPFSDDVMRYYVHTDEPEDISSHAYDPHLIDPP